MKTLLSRSLALAVAFALGWPAPATAATSSALSPAFAVDTRSASGLAGRVVAAATGLPVSGATVAVGSGSTTTAVASGIFRFTGVSVPAGSVVTVTKTGFATAQRVVATTPGARVVEMGDIVLGQALASGAAPEVMAVTPQYSGLFLEGVTLTNTYTAEVNWNGSTPASVEWWVNGTMRATTPASSTTVSATLNMATEFRPGVGNANRLEAVAVTADGQRSAKRSLAVRMLPVPGFLQGVLPASYSSFSSPDVVFSYELTVPKSDDNDPANVWRDLPFLGKFGGGFNVSAGVEYALRSGEWQFHLGTTPLNSWKGRVGERSHSTLLNPQWYLGSRSLDFGVQGVAEGVASFEQGFHVNNVGVDFTLDFKGEVLTFYLTDYVPGTQWVRFLDKVLKPFGVDPNSIQRVRVYALVGAQLQLVAEFEPKLHYGGATFGVEVGLEAAYEPDLKVVSLRIYAGGKVGATLQWPAGQSLRLNAVTGKLYGGIEAEVFSMNVLKTEFVLLDYRWVLAAGAGSQAMRAMSAYPVVQIDGAEFLAIPISESTGLSPVERPQLARGSEIFVAGSAAATATPARSAQGANASGPTPLEAFRRIGAGGVPGSEHAAEPAVAPGESSSSGPRRAASAVTPADADAAVAPAQADLPLVANAYPAAAPALAGRGTELMLLYVRDNGGAALQFTDIGWTRFDGTNWSTPAAIATDTRAEFAPQVRFDGNGDAVAVWQRAKDPAFVTLDLAAMAAQMEIVWSRWDRATGQWTAPVALTDNAYLDHRPLLCGPMTNGDVLLVWTANESNQLTGSGAAGAATNSRYMTVRWIAATKSWGAPTTLLSGVIGEMSPVLDGQSNRAVLVWSRDLDGDVTTQTDSEIFYSNWQSGTWGAAVQFTNNATSDVNARMAVSSAGDCHLVWRAGSDLNWSTNFGAPVMAREAADTTGFSDYALTLGPGGNVVLLWQEKSDYGSDAFFRIYDPASATWGQDDLLTTDAPLERSFAPVWDAAGNLTLAYLKVQMGKTTKTVTLADGSVLTIDNVPVSGQADLVVTKRALVRDAAILPGGFRVTGGNFLPGDAITLNATALNSGNVAIENLKVAFYHGDPAAGGVKIGEATFASWLRAAAKAELSTHWVLPTATAAMRLFAVVDPDGAITENREDNNRQAVGIGGTDLVARYLSSTVAPDGSARVIAEVQNIGMPAAQTTSLQVSKSGASPVLVQVEVPALEPGEIAQVALDLPAGTHPAGEVGFALEVDAAGTITDSNRFNNRAEFTTNLWLPPTIATQPIAAQAVATGGSATLRVASGGTGPFLYQWLKNGVAISGATNAMLTLSNVQAGDAGSYAVIVTNNSASSVTSNAGTITILAAGNTALHAIAGMSHSASNTVTIANTPSYTGTLSGLAWQVLLPAGWSFVADTSTGTATKPTAGAIDLLEWTWSTAPASATAFSYTLAVPSNQNGVFELVGLVTLSPGGTTPQILAQPDPLMVFFGSMRHGADIDGSGRISLLELTRVIELYNTRNGTTRTGCYAVQAGSEDGFASEPARAGSATVALAAYHSADSDRNGKLNLLELTRVIELFNTRSGTTRTGQYHGQNGTEDGFAPGP